MKSWVLNNKLLIAGIIIGAAGGYLYWQQIGCSSGTCAITSKWHNSTAYGALMGGLLFSMFKRETFGEIINGSTPVLVDFFAEWCGPCKLMKPVLEELHARMGDKVRILKIDVDKSPSVAGALQIQSVPTLMLFQHGKTLWRKSGVLQAAQLEKIIQQNSTNS